MSSGQQNLRLSHSDTNAAACACTANSHYRSHSSTPSYETNPSTACCAKPDTASACPSSSASVCCSSPVSHSTTASCGGPPGCHITIPTCCTSASVISPASPSSPYPTTSASSGTSTAGCHAPPPSDNAGAAGQSSCSSSFRCNGTSEHKQSEPCNPAAGQHLPCPAGCEGGHYKSDTMSAYSNNSST